MPDLRQQLRRILQGRVCVVGVGNVELGDDGFGVRLAERLKSEVRSPKPEANPKSEIRAGIRVAKVSDFGLRTSFGLRASDFGLQVILAGTTPERYVGEITGAGFDRVLFLDAVEFGGEPGAVVLLDSSAMRARFPQVSTHKLSLGLLAQLLEGNGVTRCWLLGMQPQSLRAGAGISPVVAATIEHLAALLVEEPEEVPA